MRALTLPIEYPHRELALKVVLFVISLLFAGFVSTAAAKGVTTRADTAANIEPGTYSVVAYGCTGANDPRAVAFLQRDDSPYHVSIIEPRAHYQMLPGLTADEAYRTAQNFVTCNPNVQQSEVSSITAPDGTLVGYALKPVFLPLRAGSSNGIDTAYRVSGDMIQARVFVDPLLQMDQMGGG